MSDTAAEAGPPRTRRRLVNDKAIIELKERVQALELSVQFHINIASEQRARRMAIEEEFRAFRAMPPVKPVSISAPGLFGRIGDRLDRCFNRG